jgi:hypothetical protein
VAKRIAKPKTAQATPGSMLGVERIRQARVRGPGDVSLAMQMDAMLRETRKAQRGLAGVAGAWNAVVPPDLLGATMIEGVARGVLTVRVTTAAKRFALDRFLRSGGEREIVRASPIPVRSVRIVVGDYSV